MLQKRLFIWASVRVLGPSPSQLRRLSRQNYWDKRCRYTPTSIRAMVKGAFTGGVELASTLNSVVYMTALACNLETLETFTNSYVTQHFFLEDCPDVLHKTDVPGILQHYMRCPHKKDIRFTASINVIVKYDRAFTSISNMQLRANEITEQYGNDGGKEEEKEENEKVKEIPLNVVIICQEMSSEEKMILEHIAHMMDRKTVFLDLPKSVTLSKLQQQQQIQMEIDEYEDEKYINKTNNRNSSTTTSLTPYITWRNVFILLSILFSIVVLLTNFNCGSSSEVCNLRAKPPTTHGNTNPIKDCHGTHDDSADSASNNS
jgi:hypothetical protein